MIQYKYRYKIIIICFLIISFIFIIKLFYIQVINKNYKFSANNNVLRYEVQQATRGLIYDRDSNLIVSNVPAYDLMVVPREINKIDTLNLCKLLNISIEEFNYRLQESKKYSKYKESVFVKHLSLEKASTLSEQLFQFNGFYLRKLTMRKYHYNVGANIIGYLGEVNEEKTTRDKYYIKGDFSGINGIEGAYEKDLRGEKGMAIKLVDVHNRDQGKFQNGKFDTLPKNGNSLLSTIDIELQKYGEKLMDNKIGAIVAIEPSTGEILSLVSSPSYKLTNLTGRNRSKSFKNLKENKNKPLFNRALQAAYPPGSIFKLVNALIILQEKIITKNKIISCVNGYEYDVNKRVNCHKHSSSINLTSAIETSCNTYFCEIFAEYFKKNENVNNAYKNWYSHVRSFGIGNYLNNDFISGSPGKLPKYTFYNKLYKNSWNANTIISMAIGQGELLLTPIQMANLAAIIANKGFYYTPHVIKKIENNEIDSNFTVKKYCSIERKYFDPIIEGMEKVINGSNGTAKNSRIADISLCGKTGTAQNPHGDDHSIFIGFAPKNNPKIAIAVYVENGGYGSKWAAPIASLISEKYITNSISNTDLEKEMINGYLIK